MSPVRSTETGAAQDALLQRAGRPCTKAGTTGTCTSAGHLGGAGTSQLMACMGVECWMPQWPPSQPHRNGGRSSSRSTTAWMATSSAQSSTGNAAIAAFVFQFLLCH